mmetsp:Transcript_32274/g.84086  ORF Transcript_32274/g.84086 Transcript_32274/m.84086 type:complete len:123 (+) Transcript_32274:282-650(+)
MTSGDRHDMLLLLSSFRCCDAAFVCLGMPRGRGKVAALTVSLSNLPLPTNQFVKEVTCSGATSDAMKSAEERFRLPGAADSSAPFATNCALLSRGWWGTVHLHISIVWLGFCRPQGQPAGKT